MALTTSEKQMAAGISKEFLEKILADGIDKFFARYQQEFLSHNELSVEEALRKFKDAAVSLSWKHAQQWCKWESDGPVLQPDRARIYYRRGSTELILVEQPPQLRNLNFAINSKTRKYALSLPFINFIFVFKKGMLDRTLVTFSKHALKDLKEKPYKPYLSNINDAMRLCYGAAWKENHLVKGQLTQQIAYTLDLFWTTTFKDEWNQNFLNYQTHFSQSNSPLATLEGWEKESLENSLFIIENEVDWLPWDIYKDYGTLIANIFNESDDIDNQFQNAMFSDISAQLKEELGKAVVLEMNEAVDKVKTQTISSIMQSLGK